MRERTNLTTLAEADSKSVIEATKVLNSFKKKWSKLKTVTIKFNDVNNTELTVLKSKYNKLGEKYFIDKYKKLLNFKNS